MTVSDWIALAGLLVAALGSAGGVWLHLTSKMSASTRNLHLRIEALHGRVNQVEKDYVRRDDLRDDMQRIERGQENMSSKLDQVILNIVPAIAKIAEGAGRGN